MPPKPRFTKEKVIETALDIVSEKGITALTARELGDALGSSARPIFTLFDSMEELQKEVRLAAMERFEHFEADSFYDMPFFKKVGMRMVLFGEKEPKLYQLLFMGEKHSAVCFDDIYGELGATAGKCIENIREVYGLDTQQAKMLFENMWIYTFGIGALCAVGACDFSTDKLGDMLTTQFKAMMMLIKSEK